MENKQKLTRGFHYMAKKAEKKISRFIFPRLSERQELIKEFHEMISLLAAFDEDEDVEELLELKAAICACRYLNMKSHTRKNKSMNELLWFYGEHDFVTSDRLFLMLLNIACALNCLSSAWGRSNPSACRQGDRMSSQVSARKCPAISA